MSHSRGTVTFADGTVLHFEYSGTTGYVASPALWDSYEEMQEHWRKMVQRECCCGNPPEAAKVHHDYGGGDDWDAPACKTCKVLLDTRGPGEIRLDEYEQNRRNPWRSA